MIRGRKDDQCAKRYNEILDPSASNRLRQWTVQEDEILCKGVRELGNQWSALAQRLLGRPPLTCRNRWRALSRCSGRPATAIAATRRANRATPQSNTTTPPNTDTLCQADATAVASGDAATIFSATRELDGFDEWLDNSFLSTGPWLDTTESHDSPADTNGGGAVEDLLQKRVPVDTAGGEPCVGGQSDHAQIQRHDAARQAEQMAEIERAARQILGSTLAVNGDQHVFHHYHHHHHYYHHYDQNKGQT